MRRTKSLWVPNPQNWFWRVSVVLSQVYYEPWFRTISSLVLMGSLTTFRTFYCSTVWLCKNQESLSDGQSIRMVLWVKTDQLALWWTEIPPPTVQSSERNSHQRYPTVFQHTLNALIRLPGKDRTENSTITHLEPCGSWSLRHDYQRLSVLRSTKQTAPKKGGRGNEYTFFYNFKFLK